MKAADVSPKPNIQAKLSWWVQWLLWSSQQFFQHNVTGKTREVAQMYTVSGGIALMTQEIPQQSQCKENAAMSRERWEVICSNLWWHCWQHLHLGSQLLLSFHGCESVNWVLSAPQVGVRGENSWRGSKQIRHHLSAGNLSSAQEGTGKHCSSLEWKPLYYDQCIKITQGFHVHPEHQEDKNLYREIFTTQSQICSWCLLGKGCFPGWKLFKTCACT